MPSCAFHRCKNTSKNKKKKCGITYHSFPCDVEMREKWISIMRQDRNDDQWICNKSSRICSAHFTEDEIFLTKQGMRKIHKTAIPKPGYKVTNKARTTYSSTSNNLPNESGHGEITVPPGRVDLIKRIRKLEHENRTCKLKIKTISQKNRRLKVKCLTLKSIIQTLEKKYYSYVDSLKEKLLKAEAAE